ncbi:MAG: aminotransferase class I/II-fold pyridoxal phosphate-dependent enzyme, partial [Actinomycetota bacterium]
WRVGWTVADAHLTAGVRVVHDFLTVAAAAPLQRAGIAALKMPQPYYDRMKVDYAKRRDVMLSILGDAGFEARSPEGAYYVMADIGHLGFEDDTKAALHLVEHVGVGTVPGSSFFANAADGRRLLRFAFPKKLETLEAAGERLREFARSR